MKMYRLSRLWNRLAYLLIRTGQSMIWDYSRQNAMLIDDDNVASRWAQSIMCGY